MNEENLVLPDMRTKAGQWPLITTLTETFGLGRGAIICALGLIGGVLLAAAIYFIASGPPSQLIITSGPAGSSFETNAFKYRAILARSHVELVVLPSRGSLENLERLSVTPHRADIGFVQSGMTNGHSVSNLMSLGSVAYQPMLVFYRGSNRLEVLSALAGKRLAIGPEGSGTRTLALTLLATNGLADGATNSYAAGTNQFLNYDAPEAAKALLAGTVDAAFMMGDSASPAIMRTLLRTPGIQLLDFGQADAYTRRFRFLNKLELPRGSLDFGKDLPRQDAFLVGPTVQLVARADLHPALSDLLIEAAQEVHGNATLLQRHGEFPAPLEQDIKLSDDAVRYYKSGKSFLYRHLPFWMASLATRIVVVIVPVFVVLVPGLKLIPTLFRWRVRLKLLRWYRTLLGFEREAANCRPDERLSLAHRLDLLEAAVNKIKIPASFADQFYALRADIVFVRNRLGVEPPKHPQDPPGAMR